MFRTLAKFFAIAAMTAAFFSSAEERKSASPEAPVGSWENWIQDTLEGADSPRPDGLARMAPLPIWVDCHLSWWVDRPRKGTETLKIPSEIILRATPRICEGELEQWAQ